VSALVLDSGVFIAVERGDRATIARLRAAERNGLRLRTNAMVVTQVWRDDKGRQADLARLLRGVDVREVDEVTGRAAGVLLARSGLTDAVDATVALLVESGDRVLTSDVPDIKRLLAAAGRGGFVVAC
jgi:hypothetical protein